LIQHQARKPFYRRLYEGWLTIAGHFGEVQTLVVIGLSYVLVIGPVALIMRRKDLLHKRALAPGSAWDAADSVTPDLARAKRMF
jgi:hypothetical protein